MKAIRVHEFGDESVLRYEEVPDPVPGPREVLVRVRAASVNRGDLGRRAGSYGGGGEPLPFTPGWEVAGVVEAVGSEVQDRAEGQRVLAQAPAGGYAELVAVHEVGTAPIPENLSFEEAATIPVVFLTSWYALHKIADVQPGEWALVQAAASGVGMAGIQIARHFGARVITTASSERKLALGRELGAEETINYEQQDFVAETMRITEGRGVDVVLESVGGEVFARSLPAMAFKGRLVTVGNSSRQPATFEPGLLFGMSLAVSGFSLAAEFASGGPVAELGRILELFAAGKLRTVVDRAFPLPEAPAAHRYLAERRNLGKVVLVP